MSCSVKYSDHRAGDSHYDHSADRVKLSVLGFAVVLTLGFSVVELVGGYLSNSLALIGDAGHMATDAASLLFALIANWISRKGVDANHSFGHGRIEVLAAFLNGLVMLGVVFWIFWEAVVRLDEPPAVAGGSVMIVAVIGLLINIGVAWSLSRDKKNLNTRAALLHVMGDLLGSVAAILAGALIYFGGESFAIADPLLSFGVGALVLHSTWGVLKESSAVLLDAVPGDVNYYDVGEALSRLEGVKRVHDLHVWTLAPGHGAMSAHLCMKEGVDWEKVLDDARDMIEKRFGIDHVTLQPEWHTEHKCSGSCGECDKCQAAK
ncbi:MAG: cation diffusion facilitator family transporter [Sutterellaceae bacterium]|nr:cation diffusion facilitator family transporter [Sutterellaceae bacterium]